MDSGAAVHPIAVMARRRIKAISSGPRPTLMTWRPTSRQSAPSCRRHDLIDDETQILRGENRRSARRGTR